MKKKYVKPKEKNPDSMTPEEIDEEAYAILKNIDPRLLRADTPFEALVEDTDWYKSLQRGCRPLPRKHDFEKILSIIIE